ncbi:MAG TPA: hypothetical protein PLJ62_01280 [Thermoflexales bacterium]|nr:hypothetical protein [Thermoflexales bacterium]HQW36123.1 hypothetical protein [Thermoflexales bacterium]HQX75015.1 hypothetical protein [Thermoflexales bacterium]HQZ21504.1 hypothetical protein [Thermoflexales bacterium]HQZ98805.1 hypothetical protein [Thermoflexales bacterium]
MDNKPPIPPISPTPQDLAKSLMELAQSLSVFANEAFTIVRNEFDRRYQWFVGGRRVLVLGEPGSGKSALRYLLQTGAPGPRATNGKLVSPPKTVGVVDSLGNTATTNVEIPELLFGLFSPPGQLREQAGGVLFLPRDVAGELREKWGQMVIELHPQIVIFMVDGRASRETPFGSAPSFNDVAKDIMDTAFDVLLAPQVLPKAVGVFINFADAWNPEQDPFEETMKKRAVEDAFLQAARANYADRKKILSKMQYFAVQLSPDKLSWPEVEAAFHALSAQANAD